MLLVGPMDHVDRRHINATSLQDIQGPLVAVAKDPLTCTSKSKKFNKLYRGIPGCRYCRPAGWPLEVGCVSQP